MLLMSLTTFYLQIRDKAYLFNVALTVVPGPLSELLTLNVPPLPSTNILQ